MTTLHDIAKAPNTRGVRVGEYDFEEQTREMPQAGYTTFNSQQTFDSQGRPYDSRTDQDN